MIPAKVPSLVRIVPILAAITLVIVLPTPLPAADVTFFIETHGWSKHPSAPDDSFASGVLSQEIADGADQRFWTPSDPPYLEAKWDDDGNADSWHTAQSGAAGVTSKGKSKAGFTQPGNTYTLVPRIKISGDLTNGSGWATASAGAGGLFDLPEPGDASFNLGGLGGVGFGVQGSTSSSNSTGTLVGLPGGLHSVDVTMTTTSNSPTNTSTATLEILIDNVLWASGFAELSPGGLIQTGLLSGVFNTPVSGPTDEMFASLDVQFTLPEGAQIVPEPNTLVLACLGMLALAIPLGVRGKRGPG